VPDMEGYLPVQEEFKVNMAEGDFGTRESVIEGIRDNVTGARKQGSSFSNIVKCLKRMRRVHKAAAVCLSPYKTPRSRRYG